MIDLVIDLCDSVAVGVFGIVLSIAFCDISWTKKKKKWMLVFTAVIFLVQGIAYIGITPEFGRFSYPLHTHLPLTIALWVLGGRPLWSAISVLTAYLCCELRRWLALVMIALIGGAGSTTQYVVELIVTLPLLWLLLKTAPAVRTISRYPVGIQCQFGAIPALYYGFDYLTRVYTNLLSSGSPAVVEFMPFVCCVSYLIFIFQLAEEQRARTHLEQLQSSLNIQINQSMWEIEALRESQRKTRAYRHDLRHHLQFLSACIENGQYEQAQEYIRSISAEIESSKVTAYCENETVNLILSAFAARAERQGIAMTIQAELPLILPVSESDLCVLLSNALENAIHACQAENEGEQPGKIQMQGYEKNGKLFLQISNDCKKSVQFEGGIPVTDRPGHGVGVRSICAIVECCGGVYSFSMQDGRFVLRISL